MTTTDPRPAPLQRRLKPYGRNRENGREGVEAPTELKPVGRPPVTKPEAP